LYNNEMNYFVFTIENNGRYTNADIIMNVSRNNIKIINGI